MGSHPSAGQPLPVVREGEMSISKWSEVAKYSKFLEDQEKVQKREKTRYQQEQMRHDLGVQMAEKKSQKQRAAEEERRVFEQQEADIAHWKSRQTYQDEERKRAALQVI